jgi:hypothetical protein
MTVKVDLERATQSGTPEVASTVWYRAAVTDEQVAAGQVSIVQRLFADAMQDVVESRGACLFGTRPDSVAANSDGPVQLSTAELDAVFFSPASVRLVPHLIAQCGATPGPAPDRSRAVLLVGSDQDWNLLPRSVH